MKNSRFHGTCGPMSDEREGVPIKSTHLYKHHIH